MKLVKCDSKGRIYLKEGIRARYGVKFILLQAPREIILLPVPADPLKDLEELGKKIPAKSLHELKQKIRARARQDVGM